MRKIILTLLVCISYTICFCQFFEGKLTYKVEFDIKTTKMFGVEVTKEQIIEKMKKEGEYFDEITITLKEGNYSKIDNSSSEKKIVYKSNINKIYAFQKDFEYVMITDAYKFSAMELKIGTEEPKIEMIDSTKKIHNITCKLLKLSWGKLGDEQYYFNSDFAKVNVELFDNHNYEYFNAVLKKTNSYPLEIIKKVSKFISVKMTLVNISEEKIDDSFFELPEFEIAEKDYSDMMFKITGSEVMKIKK